MTKRKQLLCLGLLLLLCQQVMAQTQKIPIVFHIISAGNGTTITTPADLVADFPTTRVEDQLNRLNAEFSGAGIEFCLATNAPVAYQGDGANPCTWQPFAMPGVTYTISNTINTFETAQQAQYATNANALLPFHVNGPTDPHYLNVYVVEGVSINFNAGFEGAANLGLGGAFDGVAIEHDVFGDLTGTGGYLMMPGGDEGKTLVHEIGHWLFLRHVF